MRRHGDLRMRARSAILAATAALFLAATAHAPAQAQDQACPANRIPPLALTHLRDAVRQNHDITIVAIGSSSTEGVRASDKAHSYPAILQNTLNSVLRSVHVAVLNRGIGGQDVSEELSRLEADALAVHPTLVIWQVGANGAMQHTAPDLFKRLLTGGVRRLLDGKVDVVLMDNQRAPNILSAPEHVLIDQAMADVAVQTGASLFARGALMDQWRQSGHPYEKFMSSDGIHHNDYGYRCIAHSLALAIVEGLGPNPLPHAIAGR